MKIIIDFETRSDLDLKKVGVYRYAACVNTDILCCAFKVDSNQAWLWVPKRFESLFAGTNLIPDRVVSDYVQRASLIEAFNMQFEATIWREIMVKRYGFTDLPIDKLRCSAAKSASFSLPRALGPACEALALPVRKDSEGRRIMLKLCKPNRKGDFVENCADFNALGRYCLQDVEAEYALSSALFDQSQSELDIWRVDKKINDRGVKIDRPDILALIEKVKHKEAKLLEEIAQLTGGAVKSARQVAKLLAYLKDEGLILENLNKENVISALATPSLSAKARRLLEIRQSLGKSSVSKLETMDNMASPADDRVRGSLLYYGCNTGRWSGRGIQPQNYPRDSYNEKEIQDIIQLSDDIVEIVYDCPIKAASKCLRGMLITETGRRFLCADFSAIEARVLAWIAGEKDVLRAFIDGLDLYKVQASKIFKTEYKKVTKQQRHIGKIAVLSLGYQGFLGAFTTMSKAYGLEIAEDKAKEIIMSWRAANRAIVNFWAGVETAAITTVRTRKPCDYGRVKFGIRGRFLHCRLPSGRLLSYCDPRLEEITTPYGVDKLAIAYMGVDSKTKKWTIQRLYGGLITENITQAIARDLLAEALLRLEAAGYPVVSHVHDEVLSECNCREKSLKEFCEIMAAAPAWAKGLPLAAEGWEGTRYRK